MSPLRRWLRRDDEPAAAPPAPPPADDVRGLRESLGALIRRVNSAAGRLPMGVIPEVRDTGDQLLELLAHADRLAESGASVDPYAMFTIAATINDYLPTSIETYLALPQAFLDSHHNHEGETPAEELLSQLTVLRKGVIELAQAVYTGDAQRLSTQRRFLDTKFSKSDLDL